MKFSVVASISVLPLFVVGCDTIQQHPEQKPQLTLSQTWTANAATGFTIGFNEPVQSVTWTWQGKSHVTTVQPASRTVHIRVSLLQGHQYSLTIDKASGDGTIPITRSRTLAGQTEQPLNTITNPGIWQYDVARTGPFTLKFNAPIANPNQLSSDITFNPPISGSVVWVSPIEAEFKPDQPIGPTQVETMRIKGGVDGPVSSAGQYLVADVVRPFITQSNQKIVVEEKNPETLTLYKNGHVVLKSLCNTGVTGAATPLGHYYIRSQLPKADMKGKDPDGTTYDIPDVPWVLGLFGNTAIHGYPRQKYGFPQSNGCVELPIGTAKKLYSLVKVGTPVVVER
ncbi:L,D-transpeptidase [Alicyclobacillus dauci]|uniref:L,D-transpeptidase n=1 Tax=Alicyclobacillus dauci TaxID=1475485 RepID=A0ABY6Z902_9BACL|nr:L,D-transpeptidase [Alicyclobacillus dauci]WAH38736.1 L,D-transpeptidase [Alicyclobacillus dauci]